MEYSSHAREWNIEPGDPRAKHVELLSTKRASRRRLLPPAIWAVAWCFGLAGQAAEGIPPVRPVVTNGLIHYWPNLWDAHDEVSGREGVVMGILPAVPAGAPDETPFEDQTGWVQLPVKIPGRSAFTVSFWCRPVAPVRSDGVLLGLHADLDRWCLRHLFSDTTDEHRLEVRGAHATNGPSFVIPRGTWHHLAFTKSEAGIGTLWKNGSQQPFGPVNFPSGTVVDWITAGNDVKGDVQWFGRMRDLAVFDRVLSEAEIGVLHDAGRSAHPVRSSPARRAARGLTEPRPWSAALTRRSIEDFSHRRYTAEDGLPANNVQCLLQTRDGYLWIGTDAGMARFDGGSFRSFTPENTPAMAQVGSDVRSLAEADDGTVWAGVYGGLLRLRGNEIRGFTNGLAEGYVLQAVPAGEGTLWVAGFRLDRRDRGPCRIRRIDPETGRTLATVVAPGHVRRLVPAPDGVWMATEDPEQLLHWDLKSPVPVVEARISGPPLVVGVREGAVVAGGLHLRGWQDPAEPAKVLFEIAGGRNGPVFQWLSPTRKAAASASRWMPRDDPAGWLGAQAGLFRIDSDRLEQIEFPNRPSSMEVACLVPNREGGIWLGTAEDGLHLVRDRLVRVLTTRDGLSGNDVRSVAVTREGEVLAGGPAGLDELRDGRWRRLSPTSKPPLGTVVSIAQDAFGTVWTGLGHEGIDALHFLHRGIAEPLPVRQLEWKHPTSLAASPQARLWAACELGLTWVEPAGPLPEGGGDLDAWGNGIRQGRLRAGAELPDVRLLKIVPARDGTLWIGTIGSGLLHVAEDRVQTFTMTDGLPADACSPAHLDDSGALWVVANGAIARGRGGRFQAITSRDGIPNDLLFDLIEDDQGHFWSPGHRGIHRMVRSELEAFLEGKIARVQSLSLGVRDGLLTPECTSLHFPITAKSGDGRIWVATRGGLAVLDPARVRGGTSPLITVIDQVIANRSDMTHMAVSRGEQRLKLPPGSGRHLEFHYTATSLVAADRVRFRHRLEGFESAWSPPSDLRRAFYTNLRPGTYRFEVVAANAHGVWNPDPTTLTFAIAPHFWQTALFQWTAGLLLVGGVVLLHRQRMAVLRQMHVLRQHHALTAEKERIAADIHDEIGATLTQIAILSEVAKLQGSQPTAVPSALDRISQSVRDVTGRMSDLVWATSPRHDTLANLSAYLREQVGRHLENAQVRGRLVFPDRVPAAHVSATLRRNVLLVVREAINNALKHAAPTGVAVELRVESGSLIIQVEDNGCGFDPATRASAGNGLTNMGRRLRDLGGTFDLQSTPGAGTRILLRVPLAGPGGGPLLPL